MGVSAIELRPRGAVSILDAGLRVCVRGSGVWALTLPGGALVTSALLHLADTVSHRRSVALPALLFTLAWLARGLFQAAACHHVQELLLSQESGEPRLWDSLRAALARTPSLVCAAAYLLGFNLLTFSVTLGSAFFFMSSHLVGYAVTLQGRGSPLGLYGQCARALGPARGSAIGVRVLLAVVQLLVFINLHIATNALLFVGRKLLGIDLTFVERFTSLDNPAWLLFLVAATFTLFEPLRAATSTLLLVDGRVRQEGLDLLAAVQRLPGRKAALVLVGLLGGCLFAPTAQAQMSEAPVSREDLVRRVGALNEACSDGESAPDEAPWTPGDLSPAESSKLMRLVQDVEEDVYEDEDCGALVRLHQGLDLAALTAELERERAEPGAVQARARDILARPEFQQPEPEQPTEDTPPAEPPGWWRRFTQWLSDLLEKLFRREPRSSTPFPVSDGASGQSAANVLVVALIIGVLVVLSLVLLKALGANKEDGEETALEVSTQDAASLAADPMNALSRPPEGWAHLADELAARGEYREAVRGLYLALLSRLHREGVIHYDTSLSNWDYLRQFRSRREWVPPFRELTLRFDFAWYGNLPVGEEGYRAFRTLCAPMLAPTPSPEASRA